MLMGFWRWQERILSPSYLYTFHHKRRRWVSGGGRRTSGAGRLTRTAGHLCHRLDVGNCHYIVMDTHTLPCHSSPEQCRELCIITHSFIYCQNTVMDVCDVCKLLCIYSPGDKWSFISFSSLRLLLCMPTNYNLKLDHWCFIFTNTK